MLFATDFSSYSNAALPYALAIAHQYGVKLYAAHVVLHRGLFICDAGNLAGLVEQQRRWSKWPISPGWRHTSGRATLGFEPSRRISDVIFRLVQATTELICWCLGTHGRLGLSKRSWVRSRRRFSGSPPARFDGGTTGAARRRRALRNSTEILFATDFSEESLAATPYAISLAQEHQAHLSLLHVLEKPEAEP